MKTFDVLTTADKFNTDEYLKSATISAQIASNNMRKNNRHTANTLSKLGIDVAATTEIGAQNRAKNAELLAKLF